MRASIMWILLTYVVQIKATSRQAIKGAHPSHLTGNVAFVPAKEGMREVEQIDQGVDATLESLSTSQKCSSPRDADKPLPPKTDRAPSIDSVKELDSTKVASSLHNAEPQAIVTGVTLAQDTHSLSEPSASITKETLAEPNRGVAIFRELVELIKSDDYRTVYDSLTDGLTSFLNQFRKPVITIQGQDRTDLMADLARSGAKINPNIINGYYELLLVSDKTSKAMLKFDPQIDDMISKFKKHQIFNYQILANSIESKLSPRELARRKYVLRLQRDQIRIVEQWDKEVQSISKKLKLKPLVVRQAGQKLGINELFPSFKDAKFAHTKREIDLLKLREPDLLEALKGYLGGPEYDSRIERINTFDQINYQGVASEQISAWLAQGLDVRRMMKMIDHMETNFKEGKMVPLSAQFTNNEAFESAKQLFSPLENAQRGGNVRLENAEIIKLSKEMKQKYLELVEALRTHQSRSGIRVPVKLAHQPLNSDLKETASSYSTLSPVSKQQASDARSVESSSSRYGAESEAYVKVDVANLPQNAAVSIAAKPDVQRSRGIAIYNQLLQLVKPKSYVQKESDSFSVRQASFENRFRRDSTLALRGQDRVDLLNYAPLSMTNIDTRSINGYYELLAASDKTARAMLKFDPNINAMLMNIKEKKPFDYDILKSFMESLLSDKEIVRRERVLAYQAEQLRIVNQWDAKVKLISEKLNRHPTAIHQAGEKLGISVLFPSFKEAKLLKTSSKIETLEKSEPELIEAFKEYLGRAEYDSRILLIKAFDKMKYQGLASEQVSAWLAQGLNVGRMIKMIDYIEANFKEGKMVSLSSQFPNPTRFEKVKTLFFPKGRERWSHQLEPNPELENDEILHLSKEMEAKYLELVEALRSWTPISTKNTWGKRIKVFALSFFKKMRGWLSKRFPGKSSKK